MNKHKHYQVIRAFANGWEIEIFAECSDTWVKIEKPNFNTFREYRIIPDAEGWLPWYGGESPVLSDTAIEIRYRDNEVARLSEQANTMRWTHEHLAGDIVAYRVIEQPKPKVKMWQWVLQHEKNYLCMTIYLHATREEVEAEYPDYKVVQRADWTEIEILE